MQDVDVDGVVSQSHEFVEYSNARRIKMIISSSPQEEEEEEDGIFSWFK